MLSVACTSSALVARTRRSARREDTIPSGSKLALSTSARLVPVLTAGGNIGKEATVSSLAPPVHVPTPAQEGHHVLTSGRRVARTPVGRLHSEPPQLGIGHRHRRPAPPPTRPGQAHRLHRRRDPQRWVSQDGTDRRSEGRWRRRRRGLPVLGHLAAGEPGPPSLQAIAAAPTS